MKGQLDSSWRVHHSISCWLHMCHQAFFTAFLKKLEHHSHVTDCVPIPGAFEPQKWPEVAKCQESSSHFLGWFMNLGRSVRNSGVFHWNTLRYTPIIKLKLRGASALAWFGALAISDCILVLNEIHCGPRPLQTFDSKTWLELFLRIHSYASCFSHLSIH